VNIADGYSVMVEAAARGVMPDPVLRLDEWAPEHVKVPPGNAFEGDYDLAHTPPAREILFALSPVASTSRVVCMIASQMLKTQVFICAALGWIACAPANILALEPTDGLAKRLSARFAASAKLCVPVRDKLAKPRSRDSRNTIDCKEFDGGAVYITTAGADANLAEIPARYMFADEVDREGWKSKGTGEGSKLAMAEARLTTYEGISKAYIVSSPTHDGASEIHTQYLRGTQEGYHVPCPHCGHLHELVMERFHYEYDPATRKLLGRPHFDCPDCGDLIYESDKYRFLPDVAMGGQARWVASAEGDGETRSFRLSAFYAPAGSITWARLAKEHAQAKLMEERGDHSAMQVFVNTRLGRVYAPTHAVTTEKELMKRAADEALPPRVVPDRGLVLTMFTDVQRNRLESLVMAWGPGLEGYVVDHVVHWGSPNDAPDEEGSCWAQLDKLRATPFAHASGQLLRISADAVDASDNTQDVYNYVAPRERHGSLATKGSSLRGRPIIASRPTTQDIDWRGQKVPDGVKLWQLGADTAKDYLFGRLRLVSGPGAIHFNVALTEDWFKQLLVEKLLVRWHKGRQIREYVKPNGARNEALDCVTGNLAVAYYLGLHKWSPLDWQQLRTNLIPQGCTPDLFAAEAAQQLPADGLVVAQPAHLSARPEPAAVQAVEASAALVAAAAAGGSDGADSGGFVVFSRGVS
jgi:phage terminase large subunit GpA-like protein